MDHSRYVVTGIVFTFSVVMVIAQLQPLANAVLLVPFTALLVYTRTNHESLWNHFGLILCVVLGLFIAIYRPEGFHYPRIWSIEALYEGGKPFSLYINLSKAMGGYLVIIWFLSWHSFRGEQPTVLKNINLLLVPLLAIISILTVGHLIFDISWQYKFPPCVSYFVLVNLLVTVVSEEAFFRLLIQKQLKNRIGKGNVGVFFSIALTGLLFALSHAGASGPLFWLFLYAGLVYAAVYSYTKSFLATLLTHFGVNITHFIFLEYPL